MGLKEFFKSSAVTIKLARKPTKHEFLMAIRITLIGVAAIGAITFVVKFLALAIQGM
ncbi:MAG: protein translocase SEC61 complex subunit gamma [Thaumarchaeota archaeon]|nr:protein translocase SEC61 complex subunit gamma [Nitrososphaerota archaeon]RLF99505.1 MAG: protein translocase SEC61 complex subunit gamma [Candidatus Wolframiiraptor sp.]RLG08228.1 MAG: protein translocase SEC61 complex subunit gamma [Nitrososphaerota archaeon]HDD40293.1 protein translocase SEC61 complex subunit gamma [Nitrososphaeria archaeon]